MNKFTNYQLSKYVKIDGILHLYKWFKITGCKNTSIDYKIVLSA